MSARDMASHRCTGCGRINNFIRRKDGLMARRISSEALSGVWSATPTPLTEDLTVDIPSVKRMVNHHVRLGVKCLFLAGTCGEGAWLPEREKRRLVDTVASDSAVKLLVSVQVTDNSAKRIFDNIRIAREDGADIAVIAPPYFLLNANARTLLNLYSQAIRESPLPIGIYDRGAYGNVVIPNEVLTRIYSEPKVVIAKIALPIQRDEKSLLPLEENGLSFGCLMETSSTAWTI